MYIVPHAEELYPMRKNLTGQVEREMVSKNRSSTMLSLLFVFPIRKHCLMSTFLLLVVDNLPPAPHINLVIESYR